MIEQTVKHLPPNDMDVRPFTLKENGNLIDNWIEGHKGSKVLSANHEFPNSTRWKREGHIRMNKKRIPKVTSLTQRGGRERVVRMNKQWMPIVTSLTQPDGRERVVRMNKQWMPIVTSLTQPDGRERVVRMNKQWMPIVTSLTQFDGRKGSFLVYRFTKFLKQ